MFFMDKPRKISYKGARVKGKQLERDVAKALCNIGINAKRVPMSGALSWLKGDVAELITPHMQNGHIHECKNHETLAIPEWWRQASEQALNGEVPILHFKSNFRPIYTMMRAVDFDNLVFAYEENRPALSLNLVDVPPRSHFWNFLDKVPRQYIDVYLYDHKEKDGSIDELVIIPFEMYLRIRKSVYSSSLENTALNNIEPAEKANV